MTANITTAPQHKLSPPGVHGGKTQLPTVKDFAAPPGRAPDLITVGIGGIDAGFVDVLTECMSKSCLSNKQWVSDVLLGVNNKVFSNVRATLRQIRATWPHAVIYAFGYPDPIGDPNHDCAGFHASGKGLWSINGPERGWLKSVFLPTLNSAIADAAAEAGVTYVDLSHVFKGHQICPARGVQPWANGLKLDPYGLQVESYHPEPVRSRRDREVLHLDLHRRRASDRRARAPADREPAAIGPNQDSRRQPGLARDGDREHHQLVRAGLRPADRVRAGVQDHAPGRRLRTRINADRDAALKACPARPRAGRAGLHGQGPPASSTSRRAGPAQPQSDGTWEECARVRRRDHSGAEQAPSRQEPPAARSRHDIELLPTLHTCDQAQLPDLDRGALQGHRDRDRERTHLPGAHPRRAHTSAQARAPGRDLHTRSRQRDP